MLFWSVSRVLCVMICFDSPPCILEPARATALWCVFGGVVVVLGFLMAVALLRQPESTTLNNFPA